MKTWLVFLSLALLISNGSQAASSDDPVVMSGIIYNLTKSQLEKFLSENYRGKAEVLSVRDPIMHGDLTGVLGQFLTWDEQVATAQFNVTFNANDPAQKLIVYYDCYLGIDALHNWIHTFDCTSYPGLDNRTADSAQGQLNQFTKIETIQK